MHGTAWTKREQEMIQAAVDESSRLMDVEHRYVAKMLQHILTGIADRCTIMAQEEFADEAEMGRNINGFQK